MGGRISSGVAGVFTAVYTLLVIYASLHPFTGWRDTGAPPTAFLTWAWPRYWTVFDMVTNVLGYLPLGFLWVATLRTRMPPWFAAILAALGAALLSLAMETLQNYLPTRVSSNLDLACNSLGALFGALAGVRWGAALHEGGAIDTLRSRLIVQGRAGDTGLALLALWLLAQVNPEILLFGTGDLRQLFDLAGPLPFSATSFTRLEATIAAASTVAVGVLGAMLLRGPRLLPLLTLLLAALAVKTLATAILFEPAQYAHWLTKGNAIGIAVGVPLLALALRLPRALQRAVAALAMLLATALVNLGPENPYLANALQAWQQGHFLNFNGLTRLASSLWPFLALPWLIASDRRGRR